VPGIAPGTAGSGLFGGGNMSMPSSLTLGRSASAPLGGGGPVTGGGFGSMQSRSGSGGGISAMQQFGGQSQVAMQYSGQQHSQQLYAQQRQFGGMQTTPSSSETSSGYGSGFQPPGLQSSMYTQQTQQGQAPRGQQQQWAPQQGAVLGGAPWDSGPSQPSVPNSNTSGSSGSWGNSEWQGMGGMGGVGTGVGKQSGSSGLNAPADPWKAW